MKHIIIGTNRSGSNSAKIAKIITQLYSELGETIETIDLAQLPLQNIEWGTYGEVSDPDVNNALDKINHSDGLIVICPEYNGSMPGALKYFIDYWKYPEAFEFRPVCFVGLGGRFGGLRPVEHLQQVFGYRNAHIYPERVFLINVWEQLKDDNLTNKESMELLKLQAKGFQKFTFNLKGSS